METQEIRSKKALHRGDGRAGRIASSPTRGHRPEHDVKKERSISTWHKQF